MSARDDTQAVCLVVPADRRVVLARTTRRRRLEGKRCLVRLGDQATEGRWSRTRDGWACDLPTE